MMFRLVLTDYWLTAKKMQTMMLMKVLFNLLIMVRSSEFDR